MGAFCALLGCVAIARQMAVRVLAAALAFVPAMLFGVAAVNKYYDYYQTWGSAAADLTATASATCRSYPPVDSRQQLARILGKVTGGQAAAQQGETVRLTVHGRLSHLTRTVLPLPAAAVLPGPVRSRPVPRDRADHRVPRPAAGLDQRGRRHPVVPDLAARRRGPARRPGHAGRERRPPDLAPVPQRVARAAGRHVPRRGPARHAVAVAAGAAARAGLGRRRVLRGRLLRGRPGAAVPGQTTATPACSAGTSCRATTGWATRCAR